MNVEFENAISLLKKARRFVDSPSLEYEIDTFLGQYSKNVTVVNGHSLEQLREKFLANIFSSLPLIFTNTILTYSSGLIY